MSLLLDLARDAGLAVKDVRRIVLTAPKRYKVFAIPKRNGDERVIAQPATELKALQRVLMNRVLSQLPVHESAYAYVRGRSIRQNALRHAQSDYVLKLDLENFFNSIRTVDLERRLRSRELFGVTPADFEDIYQIVFWGMGTYLPQCLSVGAPSSPMVSNAVMFDLDCAIAEAAHERGIVYTRYADDLTFSTNASRSSLISLEHRVAEILTRSPLHLRLNAAKRGLYGRGERRMITGLVITPDRKVSIGRERKRLIRSAVKKLLFRPS